MVEMKIEEVDEVEETNDQQLLRQKEENNFSFTPDEIKMLKKIHYHYGLSFWIKMKI